MNYDGNGVVKLIEANEESTISPTTSNLSELVFLVS